MRPAAVLWGWLLLLLLLLGVMLPTGQAILAGSGGLDPAAASQGGGGGTPRTLCETDYCKCSGSLSTVECSCSSQSPPQGEIVLRADGPSSLPRSLSYLKIFHCPRVIIESRAFALLPALRRIELSQLNHLTLHESALIWEPHRHGNHSLHHVHGGPIVGQYEEVYGGPGTLPAVSVDIARVNFCPQLPRFTFGGHLDHIVISDTNIGTIDSYAFTNLRGKIEKIELKSVNVDFVDALAFRRIYVDSLNWVDSIIKKLQSRSFFETHVKKELVFKNLSIDEISSSAVVIRGPLRTTVTGCRFSHISGESLKVATRGVVKVTDNTFELMDAGALAGFRPMSGDEVERDSFLYNPEEHESPHTVPSIEQGVKPPRPLRPWTRTQREFHFQNNTLKSFHQGALHINKTYQVTFEKIVLSDTKCHCSDIDQLAIELMGTQQSPQYQFATAPVHDTTLLHRATWCRVKHQYVTLTGYKEEHCAIVARGSVLWVALGVAGGLVLLAVIAGVMVLLWWRAKRKGQKHVMVVVPDKRMYRETELQVIVERTEPMALQLPPETCQLLNGHLVNGGVQGGTVEQETQTNKHVSFQ